VEETREFCRFVKKWWEEEKEGGARGRGAAGVLGEGVEWEVREEEVRERWRRVEDGLVSMLAVRVVVSFESHFELLSRASLDGRESRPRDLLDVALFWHFNTRG